MVLARTHDTGGDLARSLARRLEGVDDHAQRGMLVREFVDGQEAAEAVRAMRCLVVEALYGNLRAVWLTIARGLFSGELPYDVLGELYRAAVDLGFDEMRHLLIGGDVSHKRASDGEFPRDEVLESLTLGERKAKARTYDAQMLARLVYDSDPHVVRILLSNPRVTEALVLKLAARRPNRGVMLHEIAMAPRWLARPAIQRALMLNPYSPVRLTVTLLPLLAPHELNEVCEDKSLHPLSSATARLLLGLRGWQAPTIH
ncbi:MAG: hypothetical protein H6744_05965 [Deltaproteobacteria bacterium]|nr:hypothetical protein [Deltaproteobacteria bacterium]MCB9786224.1 hypothetical protein [Deltaproteobacteria bacterium]